MLDLTRLSLPELNALLAVLQAGIAACAEAERRRAAFEVALMIEADAVFLVFSVPVAVSPPPRSRGSAVTSRDANLRVANKTLPHGWWLLPGLIFGVVAWIGVLALVGVL